ncbi:hypothetical protein [Pedobacter psychrodurus]|uniref:hypothetical protein n=1 Tax=Pedobacter psychrodurus TaxID=2530456 RepID=UPI00292F71A7|nr:hypothetical protein [Pedobacter psychrodurus]
MIDNIWEKFSFTENKQKSALDYLNDLKSGLTEQSAGELTLETEAVNAIWDGNANRIAAVYKLFVVAPKLGNFRRKILSVAEYGETGRFPVDIINHFEDNFKYDNISEPGFMTKVNEILSNPIVKNSIENLFQQSREYNK